MPRARRALSLLPRQLGARTRFANILSAGGTEVIQRDGKSGEARHLLELSRPDHDIHNHDKRVFMAITNEVQAIAARPSRSG